MPGSNVQQVHMIHLPSDPPNVFYCALTVSGLQATFGGVGGTDLLTGSYDVLTDTFTPNTEAAALNTTGTEFGMMLHHSGLYAVFDRLPGLPWLAARPAVGQPWTIVGQINSLPSQSYYDPALADFGGQTYLLHVYGTSIGMTPINLSNATLTGPTVTIVNSARVGSTANSPTPIVDTAGSLIGLSHHDVLSSDNDHYVSLDLDPNTPPILMHDSTTWRNNGAFVGGRFFDAESTAPYHILAIDTFWTTGGRGPIGGTIDVFAYTPPTTTNEIYFSFLVIGAGFLPTGVPVPPIAGELGIDLSTMVTVSFPQHNNMNGEALVTLPVPNVPFLQGRALPVQLATFQVSTNSVTLGNTAQLAFY
ncbi:MAG TPA: hypothetical protein VK081_12565 [Planctomycetota bacterium]|nr:hypothetical protein [Planctomycetota bacterium]